MYKISSTHILVAMAVIIIPAAPVYAKTYRCEGLIQFRPCDVALHTPKRPVYVPNTNSSRRYSPALDRLGQFAAPQISKTTFKKLSNGEGIWRGFVSGVGKVALALQIKESGKKANHYSIGQLEILPTENPVRFTYKSVVPRGANWTWRVVANRLQG